MKKIRKKYLPGNCNLRVGKSGTGCGLFAKERISRGACVTEYTGREISSEEQYTHRGLYLFETGRNRVIDGNVPTNIARYINHSCQPNCEIIIKKHRVYIFTQRTIKPGEELTYDYGEEYFNDHIKPKGCRCRKCLGI